MFSCKSDPVLFELTTNVNPIGSGTISPDKGSYGLEIKLSFLLKLTQDIHLLNGQEIQMIR